MNNQEFQQGSKEAYNHQLVSSPSGSLSQFTEETLLEEQQKINTFSEDDKLIKNQQLFLAIRIKLTYEEQIRKIDEHLEQGADIGAIDRNDNDNTPLHIAVRKCEPEIVSALLDRGAVINAKNADDETPVDVAKRLHYQSIMDIFTARTTPHYMISHNERSISTSQIEIKININQDNEAEKNPQAGFTERPGAEGLHGFIYQLKLLMLFLKRGLDKKYSFRLSTENKEFKKFDDLIFEINSRHGKKEYRLLQAKHKTDNSKKITFDNLLKLSGGDYNLVKYFFSYHDLKNNLINKGIIRDVTVCTNIDFDLDSFNSTLKDMHISDIVKKIDNCDDILYYESTASVTSKRYQFKKEIVPLLKPLLLKYNLIKPKNGLAERLVDCVANNKVIDHHNEPFNVYHIILAEEVIDIKHKIFYKKFVNGSELSEETEWFREIFEKKLREKLPGLCFRDINQLIVNSRLCFKLSKEFGYSEINQNWPENAEDVKELAKNLIHTILKAEIINTNGAFKLYHAVLAKEVIDIKENKFIDQFVNGEGISKDAKRFRNALESESELQGELSLKGINKAIIDKSNNKRVGLNLCEQFGKEGENKTKTKNKKRHRKDTILDKEIEYRSQGNFDLDKTAEANLSLLNKPVDDNKAKRNWPRDSISAEEINDFLDHLVFAVNQPNEYELGKVIENDIGQDFNFVARDYVYNELFVRMIDWLKGKGEEFISYEDGKSLFDDIKNNLCEFELTSISLDYQYKIKKYDINFKKSFDSELCNFLKLSDTKIFHVITKDVTLSAIKVHTILTSLPKHNHCYNYIFMKFNSVLRQQYRVEQALKIPKNVFVITCKTTSKDKHQQYNQLFNIMKSSNSKNIILISHENDSIDQKFKVDSFFTNKYNEVIDGSIKFIDLSTDSQKKLLETSAIIFQGIKISLNKLITDDDSKDLIEPEVLFMLISNVDVKIGNTSSKLGAMDHYFMYRKLYSCENIEESFKKEFYFTYNSNIETSRLEENQDIVLISDLSMDFPELYTNDIMDELCNTYEKHNIHEIRKQGEKLIWLKTRYKRKSRSLSQSSKNCKKHIGGYFADIIPLNIKRFISKQNIKNRGIEIKDITDNVVIFSADPGMGKSTMLAYLSQQLKEEFNPVLWVEIIDIKDHTESLENLKLPINLKDGIKFLLNVIGLKTHLEKEFFKLRINKLGKIILLFDGFDEISPKWKEIVLELLHILRSTKVERLWVTTRPHLKYEIAEKLDVSSYTLEPLSLEAQQIFLMKHFSKVFDISYTRGKVLGYYTDKVIDDFSKLFNKDIKFALDIRNYKLPEVRGFYENSYSFENDLLAYQFRLLVNDRDENLYSYEIHKLLAYIDIYLKFFKKSDPTNVLQLIGHKTSPQGRLHVYTIILLKTISIFIHDSFKHFTGIPLHLRMLAEIFQDNFKDFYDSEEYKINFSEVRDLLDNLHEAFLKKKYETYWKNNNKTDLTIPSALENYETLYLSWKLDLKLLAVSMIFDDREISILSEENKNKIDEIKRNMKEGKERAGIIRITSNDTLTFLHHSFAEYLAADYIYDKLKFFSPTDNLWIFLDKTIFVKDYKNIRRFFDNKLAKGNELARLKFQSNSEIFYEEHLYVATDENLLNIIELLLEIVIRNSCLIVIFKKFFIKVVDVAVRKNHKDIVQVLLKYVKRVDTDGIIENVSLKYVWIVAHYRDERMLDIFLQYIKNSDLVVQILKSVDHIEIKNMKLRWKNVVYKAVDNHRLTGNHALFKHIKKLNYDDRFNVLYSFEESIDLTDHHMYLGSKLSPMHRAKQIADCCKTCGDECQQYVDLCSLMDGIREVHEYLINNSNLSPLEVAKLLSKVIERIDWTTANVIRAVLKTKSDTVKKCIINTKIDKDKTLLHLACGSVKQHRFASLSMIEFLVDHEADLNVQDNDGRTPLHFAVCACNALEVVKYLVGKGADFTAIDSFGKTPLLLAEEKNNFEVVHYLVRNTIEVVVKRFVEFRNM